MNPNVEICRCVVVSPPPSLGLWWVAPNNMGFSSFSQAVLSSPCLRCQGLEKMTWCKKEMAPFYFIPLLSWLVVGGPNNIAS